MLAMEGHEVRTAYDGVEALQISEDFQPEVVLLDIGMPKLDGYETARRLRQRPGGGSLLLVAQTGWGQEDDKQRAKQAGFDNDALRTVACLAARVNKSVGASMGIPKGWPALRE
jgi:CheY-like chemotaxis protein